MSAAVGGCGETDDRPVVVLYASADEYIARQVIEAFEQAHPYRVKFIGDTEAQKTTGLVQRLRRERDHPVADVFWSSEVFGTIALAEEGVLQAYEPAGMEEWPSRFRDRDHLWYGFAARARVIVYNPDRMEEADLPQTWMDLIQPRFRGRGRVVMADPRFGTTGGHLAAMRATWNRVLPGAYIAFLEGLQENGVRMLPGGNAAVVEAVARGEADVGMTDTDDVWAAQARGLQVELIYARHSGDANDPGGGTLLIPNTVALVAGAPHVEAGRVLVDFLLSEEVERLLAASVSGNVPIRPGLAALVGAEEVPFALRVDYEVVESHYQDAVSEAMAVLRPGDAP